MSKFLVEGILRDTEEFLDVVRKTLRKSPDEDLAKLASKAGDAANQLRQAHQAMNRNWEV